MKAFKDNAGRTWEVEVTTAAVKRVRGLVDVDLVAGTLSGDLLDRLADDPILLCDLIYALCKPQADREGVSDEDFGRAMAGDAIERATAALLEELVGFFPSPKRRILRKALDKMETLQGVALAWADEKLDGTEMEDELRRRLANAGERSTTSPASSA